MQNYKKKRTFKKFVINPEIRCKPVKKSRKEALFEQKSLSKFVIYRRILKNLEVRYFE